MMSERCKVPRDAKTLEETNHKVEQTDGYGRI